MPIPHTKPARWPGKISAARFAATIRRDSAQGCAVALLGLPDDTGVRLNHGRPGATGGPAAFRAALARYGAADSATGPLPRVFDAGDIRPGRTLDETHRRVAAATSALLNRGLFPIAIGGGHDLTYPFVRAVAQKFPKPTGLYFDAHLDVRETAGSGMPFRRLVEDCAVPALHLHGFRPLVNSREHLAWFKAHGGRIWPDQARIALPRARHLFVSFDLDVLDAAHAPGVSALNPWGISADTAIQLARAFGRCPSVALFDLMEYSPAFDRDGRTGWLLAFLVAEFIQGLNERERIR